MCLRDDLFVQLEATSVLVDVVNTHSRITSHYFYCFKRVLAFKSSALVDVVKTAI